jgi:4-carboxymuconolactone decarboxylase
MPPSDIDPLSGSRLPLLKREDLDEAGQRAYDHASAPGRTIVGLRGPAGIHLYSTGTVGAHTTMNQYLRFDAGFDPKVREVAIMTVARQLDSQFEWAAHEPEALQVGVPAEVVDIIKNRKSTQGIDETYAAIIEFGRQMLGGNHKVDSSTFARIKAIFGPNKLVQLVLLMGNYASTAMLLAAVDVQVPTGKPQLPTV